MATVSTSTAAKRLGISRSQVARLCKSGKLKATRPADGGWYQVQLPDKSKPETASCD